MKGLSRFLFSVAAVMGAMAAVMAVFYKITKKHLKINVEVLPDDIEDENELTAAALPWQPLLPARHSPKHYNPRRYIFSRPPPS